MGAGISEIGQHPVAHVFGDEPIEPCDDLGDGTMIGANDVAQILEVETRGQGCRPDEIAKHDGQLTPLCLGRGPCLSGMRGSPRLGAREGRSGGREEADAAGSRGWNWIRRHIGSAELGNGFEQLAAVPNEADAEILEVVSCQLRQQCPIDFVLAKSGLVLLETQAAQPRRYVHRRLPLTLVYPPQPPGKIQFAAVLVVDLRLPTSTNSC